MFHENAVSWANNSQTCRSLQIGIVLWYAAEVLHTDFHPVTDSRFAVQYNLYFCCFIKESCRWHWLASPENPRLLPGAGPPAPRARPVALGIVMKMVLASQAPCRAPGDLQGPQTTQNPYPGGGGAVHSVHLDGVKTEGSHLHTRAAIWVWPRSVKLFYGHGNSDSMQFLHVTKY